MPGASSRPAAPKNAQDAQQRVPPAVLQLNAMPPMRARILLSAGIGLASGLLCWTLLSHLQVGAYDFTWALHPARERLAGRNPYAHIPSGAVGYPMTGVLLAVPFAWLPDSAAAGLFFGISSALLALGLTRESYTR